MSNYESPRNIIQTGSDVEAIKNMHDFITTTSHTPMILCKKKCIEFLCRILLFSWDKFNFLLTLQNSCLVDNFQGGGGDKVNPASLKSMYFCITFVKCYSKSDRNNKNLKFHNKDVLVLIRRINLWVNT